MKAIKRTFGFIVTHPLAKRHLMRSFGRFFWWQIQLRLSSSKVIIKQFVAPVRFYAARGLTGITGNIYTGLHEFNDMTFLLHLLRPDDIFLDIGANVGSYTLLASGKCGAKTIAVEPVRKTFDMLVNNVILNHLTDHVTLVNAAAGATNATVTLTGNEDTTNHVIEQSEITGEDAVSVSLLTVDSLSVDAPPLLVKIDVEGYETEVLKGMSTVLNAPQLKAIIIELNGSGYRYGFDDKDIHDQLIANQFKPYQYDPFTRNLELAASFGNFNTLYCRDVDFISERLATAKSLKIMGEQL